MLPVKAGKSSFVNALLQADICKTAADPCTDVIQQIVYSEERFEKSLGSYLRKIGLPNQILKTLSVVELLGQILSSKIIRKSPKNLFPTAI